MKIEVRQDDIDLAKSIIARAERWRSRCCPIAQAIKRQVGLPCSVGSFEGELFDYDGNSIQFYLREDAKAFVRYFDNHEDVDPTTVTIHLIG